MTTWLCCDLAGAVQHALATGSLGNLRGAVATDRADAELAADRLVASDDPLAAELLADLVRHSLPADPYASVPRPSVPARR